MLARDESLGDKATIHFGLSCWDVRIHFFEHNQATNAYTLNKPKVYPGIPKALTRGSQATVRCGKLGKPISFLKLATVIRVHMKEKLVSVKFVLIHLEYMMVKPPA